VHIAFLLTHGFAARMVLRSGVARRLVAQGARVTIISPNAGETYFQRECKAENISLMQEPNSAGRIASWYRAYRPYLLDDVFNNAALKDMHSRQFANRPLFGFTMKVINQTLARSDPFRRFNRALERQLNRSKMVNELLDELRPNLLVLPNPFGITETLYSIHARELKIALVCQMLSWDNITSKGTPLLMPDYFISWGPVMTEELIDCYHFPRDKIFECGVPNFDVYSQKDLLTPRRRLLKGLKLPDQQPYIFYGTVAGIFCPNEIEILEWIATQVEKNAFAEPCSLVIRPHPQTVSGFYAWNARDLDRLKSLAGPRVALDIPSVLSEQLAWDLPKDDMYRLASLLADAAMCLNASSTLCLDACMLDCPVINIGFDGWQELSYERSARRTLDYIHMAKLLKFGGIRVARSFSELHAHINAYLHNPRLDHEARMFSAVQECGPSDGQASERVAATLLNLCGSKVR
jgi:hypothetical protein